MSDSKAKKHNAKVMIEYFTKLGRVPDEQEYVDLEDRPVKVRSLRKVFSSWRRMLIIIENVDKEAFARIGKVEEVKPAVKPKPVPAVKALDKDDYDKKSD